MSELKKDLARFYCDNLDYVDDWTDEYLERKIQGIIDEHNQSTGSQLERAKEFYKSTIYKHHKSKKSADDVLNEDSITTFHESIHRLMVQFHNSEMERVKESIGGYLQHLQELTDI